MALSLSRNLLSLDSEKLFCAGASLYNKPSIETARAMSMLGCVDRVVARMS